MPRQHSSESSDSDHDYKKSRRRSRSRSHRRHSSSSSTESFKNSKKYSKNNRSRSPKSKNRINDNERTKDLDFTDVVNDLHKNEKTRQKQLNKLEDSGGFQPKSFKSSRSDKKRDEPSKFRSDKPHESVIFSTKNQTLTQSADSLLNPNIVSSSNKSIMSDLFFQDVKQRQTQWKQKMIQILNSQV